MSRPVGTPPGLVRQAAPYENKEGAPYEVREIVGGDYRASVGDFDQPVDGVAGLAVAFGAHDAKHVELTLDVAEDEIGPGQMPSPRWKLMRQRTMFLAEWEMEQ